MTRVTRGFVARRRRKKVLRTVRGCRARRSRLFRTANQQAMKSHLSMYTARKRFKRERRSLWIKRINACVRSEYNISYSHFIHKLRTAQCGFNRKSLAQLAVLEPESFHALVKWHIPNSM